MYILVIDTRNYSGNFIKQMSKYCIGFDFLDCSIKRDSNPKITEEILENIQKHISGYVDESEHTSVEMYPTPNRFNHGLGECFDDTEENLILAKASRNKILEKIFNIKYKTLEQLKEDLESPVYKYEAYESVAFYFKDNTPREIFRFISELAQDFCKENNLTYVSTRLLHEKTTIIEEYLS